MNIDHSEGYLKPCTCNECNEHLDATKKSVTSSNESQSPIVDASIEDIYRLYLDYAKDNDSTHDDIKVSEDNDATNVISTTTTSQRVYGKVWTGETTWRYCSHGPLTPCNSPTSSPTSPRRSPTPPMRTTSPTQPRRVRSKAQTPTTTTRSTTNNGI